MLHAPRIHVRHDQFHLAWDRSIPPTFTAESGGVAMLDALDVSRGDEVNGPIDVAGALPGETLPIEEADLTPASWGRPANTHGFGLPASDFREA